MRPGSRKGPGLVVSGELCLRGGAGSQERIALLDVDHLQHPARVVDHEADHAVVDPQVVHAALGHIDWSIFAVLVIGVVPGARIGANIALGTRERTLRLLVGTFLLAVSIAYGVAEVVRLLGG